MELTQLRYVVAVSDFGNFTRASEHLGIAQPSLSQQIIKLEQELGHKLFHRLGRKAVLTEAGKALIDRARRILFEVEDATKELGDSPSLERRITVGTISTIATNLIPTLIQRCRTLYPNLQINIREDFRSGLIEGIIDGELDLAIAALPLNDLRLSVETLLVEPLLLVVAKDHALVKKDPVQSSDLANETFIMMGSSSSLAAQVRSYCGGRHFEPRIGFQCAQVATVKALVAIGAGISILPRMARSSEDRDTLAYIDLREGSPSREIAVFRHLQRYQSRGAEQFLNVLRQTTREIAEAG